MRISNMGRWLGKQAKFLAAIVLAAVIGGVTTAGVMAAIPDANGTIHACYTTGLLARVKIIDSASQTCGSGETAINWSQNSGGKSTLVTNTTATDFSGANWVGWDLRTIDFSGGSISNADLRATDFRGADLTGTNLSGSVIERSNLSNQTFTDSSLVGTYFKGADLSGVDFANADIRYANFSNQNLSGYDFSDSGSLEGIVLENANFSDVALPASPNIKNANLNYANLSGNDFSGANFAGTHLDFATFGNSDLTNVIWVEGDSTAYCPDLTAASDHGDTCIGHL